MNTAKLNIIFNMRTKACDELMKRSNDATRTLNEMDDDDLFRATFEAYADQVSKNLDNAITKQREAGEALQMAEQAESEIAA